MESIADQIIRLSLSLPLIRRIKPNFRASPDRETPDSPGRDKNKNKRKNKKKETTADGSLDTYV